jgi:transcriptional regulator with XRE-family HTH domain
MSTLIDGAPAQIDDGAADRLRQLREATGLSQTEFGRRYGFSGPAWNNYERGCSRINLDDAIRLALLLGTTLDWIYTGRTNTDQATPTMVQMVLANAKIQIAQLTGIRMEAVELRLEIEG